MADDADPGGGPAPPHDPEEPENPHAPPAPEPEPSEPSADPTPFSARAWFAAHRPLALSLAFLAICAVLGVDVFFMLRATSRSPTPAPVNSAAPPSSAALAPQPAPAPNTEVPLGKAVPAEPEADLETGEDEGPATPPSGSPAKPPEPKHFRSVHEASIGSCSTVSVDGLSRQIIDQGRCIDPKAFVPLPRRPNLVMGDNVFPYLEQSARNGLLRVLDAHRDGTMTINSALRTVAQQYLAYRWGAGKRCGVQMATPPGESNHETGLALDIAEQAHWRPALEAEDFRWLGPSDRVHFDYKGNTKSPRRAIDVLAFQQLWNRNHPDDRIPETGKYNPVTEQRLKKSPPDGFPLGATCGKARTAGGGRPRDARSETRDARLKASGPRAAPAAKSGKRAQ